MERFGSRSGISLGALSRHRADHIAETIAASREVETAARADTLLDQIQALQSEAEQLLQRAKGKDDIKAASAVLGQMKGLLELLAKVQGQLRDGPTVNVLVSQDWQRMRSAIIAALAPFPDARQAVAGVLLEHQQ